MQRLPVTLSSLIAVAGWLVISTAPAHAQITGNVDLLKADLHGDDVNKAVAAASALGSLENSEALDALMGALQLGAPPKLLGALIEALGLHKNPKTLDLLNHFCGNRNTAIREIALKAVGGINAPRRGRILIGALGDSHPMVRATAARLIGELKLKAAERPLFRMLQNGDVAAATPLGLVGGVEMAKQLAEQINKLPDAALARAFGQMLRRDDFGPDPLRTQVVKALGKIPGAEATAALVEYVASVPEKEVRLSKKIAENVLERRQK